MSAFNGFKATKEALATAIGRLCEFFERRGQRPLLLRARDLGDKLAAEQFNLVVLGQFKRGKSTLINALLGADLLPTAVVPLTSIVTIIHHGPEPGAIIRFFDGRQLEVDVADVGAFITEPENPHNIKGVAQVEVSFPSDFLMDGVRLVDTPGVGSVFASNTGTTHNYLPEADAAIFLLTADQPISQAELEFLHTVRQYAAKFFFVLNKIDYLSEQELRDSLAFSARVIAESLESEVLIHPLSARTALISRLASNPMQLEESRLATFERALSEFLLRDKGTTLLASIRSRVGALVSEALNALELELSATRMPAEVLAERIVAFQKKAAEILQEQSDTEYLLRGEFSSLLSRVEADLRAFVDDHVLLFTRRIGEAFERHQHLGTGKLIEAMNAETAGAVEEMFAPWRSGEEQYVRETFDRITSRFVERANRIIAEIRTLAADLFDVRITPIIEVEPFTTESSHYYDIDDLFMLQLARLPLLLPGSLAKRYIRRQFVGNCRTQLDLNAGRLRSDVQARLQKSARAFSASFNAKVQATLDGLEDTLRRAAEEKQRSEVQLEAVQRKLEDDRAAVAEILALMEQSSAQSAAIS
jgi:GTP-binding protein EngB required for normal cell division/enoyl-CoA hydratase/carnithine racemase